MKSTVTRTIVPTKHAALVCAIAALAALGGSNQAWADPGMVNLAVGKTATSTRDDFGGTADKGVDGNRDGNFGNGSVFYENADPTPGATSYFYQVDLGQNDYINRIQFMPRTDADQNVFGNFNLSIYPDDGTGHPAATPSFSHDYNSAYFGDSFATADPGTAAPGGANGRFARITRLDNNYWLTFAEMEVIGAATPLPFTANNNLAAGKQPTTSSPPGFGATLVSGNDGNISGDFNDPTRPVYHSSNHSVGEYWQVDLGASTPLAYAELFARAGKDNNSTSEFKVSVLDSSLNLVGSVIVDNSDVNGSTPGYDHTINLAGLTGEFIRVETTTDSYLAFSELQAFAAVPTTNWVNPASGSWGAAANWSTAAVPNGASTSVSFGGAIAAPTTVTVDGNFTVASVTFDNANARYTLSRSAPTSSLTVAGTIAVVSGAHTLSVDTKAAAIDLSAPAVQLNISDSSVVIDYSTGGTSPYSALVALVTGGKLVSTVGASTRTVGLVEASDLGGTSFGNLTVDGSAVLMRGTFEGDANLDLTVNFADLVALAQSYGKQNQTWFHGDFNYDGIVNFQDLVALAQNYGSSALSSGEANQLAGLGGNTLVQDWLLARSLVPEPTSFALLGVAFVGGRRRRIA